MGQLPAHEAPCRYGAYAGHEVQLVALPVQLEHWSLHALQLPPLSAYSRGAHAPTHEVAALKGVPLSGQLAQSAAVAPVHVAQDSWQLSQARTCAGYLCVSPHISQDLPAHLGRIGRDARASAVGRGEGQS
jgi:hypothetical protein